MQITKRIVGAIAVLVLLGGINTTAMEENRGKINYTVRALLPENQIDDQVSSFHLKVAPGHEQVLQVVIKNKSDEDIEVAAEANTAFSNSNGLIEFSYTQERDESMKVDFSRIVTPIEPVITVPANSEAVAEFILTVPNEPFKGVVYGGLMFTKLPSGESAEGNGGMAIRNVYRYAIGVRLYENETAVEPAFELASAEIDPKGKTSLLLHLRNPQPVIARDMALRVKVYPQEAAEPVITLEKDRVAMAPNSMTSLRARLDNPDILTAGSYRVSAELEFEGRIWQLETPLTVD